MTSTWNTIRIFISSTFRDMHAERDHLVKIVFPELRERCEKRQLHIIDIDLRWGVTEEEAEAGKVLEIILDEAERSRPFFIGILGERYGSIPDNIPEEAEFAHPWLRDYPDHSLTALEIIHGVLRNQELAKRSFFYFRDPQFISKMPENLRGDFIDENSDAAQKLAALKDQIRSSNRPAMENYQCRWDDSKESLVDLDVFGQKVLEDLWSAIQEEYPEGAPQSDPLTIERQMHEAFVEERSHLHVGCEEEAVQLTKHVQSADWRPVVITGESGCGKSAFLASWYRQYVVEHPDDHVLAYFIGASPDSTDHMRLLRNMCKELKSNFNLEENLPEDDKKLSKVLMSLLLAASQGRRIVILLDALDQLSAKEEAHGLGWLLDYLTANVHLVVSSLEGDALEVLCQRGAEGIALQQLTAGEQRQIVQARLNEWGRTLDEQQISALLAHPGVENPLYLRVALEELRLFGRYEQLTGRIVALAPDVSHLFEQVLARLEEDHGREFVAETFSLLGCSRYGLSENELLELLQREGEEQLPRALWVRLFRSAKAYLVQRGELVGFFHSHLADAVSARYLSNENRHAKLAAYFEQVPLERKLDEYPYQLQHAEEWQSLAAALSDLDFFEYAWNKGRKYEWMAYWESLKESNDPEDCYQKVIDKRLSSTGKTVEIARYMNKIGEFLSGMSIYIPALSMFENSLTILNPVLGSDHPEVAALLYNIARAYDKQYGESKAELVVQYYNDAYEKYMKLGKPLEASEAKIESANFKRRALKRLKEAKKDCEEAKETLESMSEKNHTYKLLYARCLNILGLIYSGLGDSELVNQCQNLFQQSINYKKEVGDLDGIGESENAMGLFLRNTANRDFNKINEAINHLNIALEIRNSIGNYRGAAQSCRNLGMCYTDRIAIIEDVEEKEESYRLAKQSYLNGINYWNKRKGKPPIEDLLEFKYRLGELEINQGNKKEGINILEELQEERDRIGDWHNRARALDLLLKAYRGTNESKVTAYKIITIYQNVLADETKIKQIYEEPVRFKNAKGFLEIIIKEVPEYEWITSKILEDISKIFDDNRG
jgi:Domain of unknown function (DUF4062)/NACHT domain